MARFEHPRMDALGHNLPEDVQWRIFRFEQHPTAALIKQLRFERVEYDSNWTVLVVQNTLLPGRHHHFLTRPDHDGCCRFHELNFPGVDFFTLAGGSRRLVDLDS